MHSSWIVHRVSPVTPGVSVTAALPTRRAVRAIAAACTAHILTACLVLVWLGLALPQGSHAAQTAQAPPASDSRPNPGATPTPGPGLVTAKQVAPRLELLGHIWNKFSYYPEAKAPFDDDYTNHAEVQFGFKSTLSKQFQVVLQAEANVFAYGNYGNDQAWRTDWDIRFHNAYLNWLWSHGNLRLGNQIVRWGKADEVSPLDNVNPEDFRDGFVRPRVERKRPIPMVNAEWLSGVYTLQVLYIPVFVPALVDKHGTNWALFHHIRDATGPFQVVEEKPGLSLDTGEAGARFAGKISAFDYAVSYLYTWEDLPSVGALGTPPDFRLVLARPTVHDLARFTRATAQPVPLQHRRQHIAGFEFETVLGSVGLRGDFAYIHERHFLNRSLQAVRKPIFQYVLGIDYTGLENFYANFQFMQTVILEHPRQVLFFETVTNEINGRLSYKLFQDKMEVMLRYFYNLTQQTLYLNPAVVLKYWPNIDLTIGADLVDSPRDTVVGLYYNNDQMYLTVRVVF